MIRKCDRQKGLSLVEMAVVIAAIAVLSAVGVPALKSLMKSMEVSGGVETLINSSLSTARAYAIKDRKYTGVRFQQDINGDQYLVLIHNYKIDSVNDIFYFKALMGFEPVKLPGSARVADLKLRADMSNAHDAESVPVSIADFHDTNTDVLEAGGEEFHVGLTDITAFSVVFSPSGKLITKSVRVRNREGVSDPGSELESKDEVFNGYDNIVDNGIGLLLQDDYAEIGLGAEKSCNGFVIYDNEQFEKMTDSQDKYEYLKSLSKIFVNPYTGQMVRKSR